MMPCALEFLETPPELAKAFREAFHDSRLTRQSTRARVRVVVTTNLAHHRLKELRDEAEPVLPVGILGSRVAIGPGQGPGSRACLACLQHWTVTSRRRFEGGYPIDEAAARLAASMAAETVAGYIASGQFADLDARLLEIDAHSAVRRVHPVFGLRSCRRCSRSSLSEHLDLEVHVSPLTGIVQQVQCTPTRVAGAYHALAVSVNPVPARGSGTVPKHQNAFGSGNSVEEATLRCIGEAIEEYSLVHRGTETLRRAPMADLCAIDPRRTLLYSDRQYERREAWNRTSGHRYWIPERYQPEREIDWMSGTDLTDGTIQWVAAGCCLTWYRFRADEPVFCAANSGSSGSGRTLSDALASALLEAIERDAVAIWWYSRARRQAVDLEAIDDPHIFRLRDAAREAGRVLELLDVTTDLKIPTYVAVNSRHDGREPVLGSAAHPSPMLAASKAMREAIQNWYITRMQPVNLEIRRWMETADLHVHEYLRPCGQAAPALPQQVTDSAPVVALAIRALTAAGLKPVAVNLSRPDTLLRTVRVLAPGLRPLSNRLAPGRLYEVPHQLGWSKTLLDEGQLNPIDCPF